MQGKMEDGHTDTGGAVTATIVQRIDPECEQAYEALMSAIHTEVRACDGFLRREVIKAASGPHLEYTSILHFDNETNLHRWEHSPERLRWATRMSRIAAHTTPLHILTGLETWFTLSAGQAIVPPPRYKMAIVTALAIFPLITLLSYAMAPVWGTLPIIVHTLISTAVLVPLMTYVVMPRLTRLFQRWLYPRPLSTVNQNR